MLRTKPKERVLSDYQVQILTNALRIAAETFDGYVVDNNRWQGMYDAMSDADKAKHDAGMINGRAYRSMAGQFAQQAEEVRNLAEILINGDDTEDGNAVVEVIVRTTPED